jgi:hypothetical protein
MNAEVESPYNFFASRQAGNHTIEYTELVEARMGGIELGYLHVDGCPIDKRYEFGGPPLIDGEVFYVPRFERGGLFTKQGFTICRVNMKTKAMEVLTPKGRFQLPCRKDGSRLYYFEGFPLKKEGWAELKGKD